MKKRVQFLRDRCSAFVWLRALAMCSLVLTGEEILTKSSKLTRRLRLWLHVLIGYKRPVLKCRKSILDGAEINLCFCQRNQRSFRSRCRLGRTPCCGFSTWGDHTICALSHHAAWNLTFPQSCYFMSTQTTNVKLNRGLLGTRHSAIGYAAKWIHQHWVPLDCPMEEVVSGFGPAGYGRHFLRVPTKTQAGTPYKHMTHSFSGK